MKLQFPSATESVTGSCYLLTGDKHRLLLERGRVQGGFDDQKKIIMPSP